MEEFKEVNSSLTAANQLTELRVAGMSSVGVQISGTWVATMVFEGTIDGINYFSVNASPIPSGVSASSAIANGVWVIPVAGFISIRAKVSLFTSGTIKVAMRAIVPSPTFFDRIATAVTAVTSTFTGFLNTLPWGIYHATPTTRSDGQGGPIETDAIGSIKTTMTSGLSKSIDSITSRPEGGTYVNLTATGLVRTGAGNLKGFYVNSTTAGIIYFEDALTDTTPAITGSITPLIGWHSMGNLAFGTGLYFKLVSGSINITLVYTPTP